MSATDSLWGGSLTGVLFDPVDHACRLEILTIMDGQTSRFEIACDGVSELQFRNAIPEPWSSAEVTEVHETLDQLNGRHTLELILWSESAAITIVCAGVVVQEVDR
ncbi:hypothetical protein ACPCG0_09960 [Propionibacteriaceae bacterium Y1923]